MSTRIDVDGEGWQADHGATVAGHIPGARHLPYTALLDERGSFRSPVEPVAR